MTCSSARLIISILRKMPSCFSRDISGNIFPPEIYFGYNKNHSRQPDYLRVSVDRGNLLLDGWDCKGQTVQVVEKVPIVPAPSFYSSPATRGRTQVGVERLKRLERLEPSKFADGAFPS